MQTCIQEVNVSNLGLVQAFLACQAMKQQTASKIKNTV
jgi:hypothetical protein